MVQEVDEKFYQRADEHIHLSNRQVKDVERRNVGASMMFAVARFDAWVSASGVHSSKQMKAARKETIEYFVAQYQQMFEENFDDYADNFDKYLETENNNA